MGVLKIAVTYGGVHAQRFADLKDAVEDAFPFVQVVGKRDEDDRGWRVIVQLDSGLRFEKDAAVAPWQGVGDAMAELQEFMATGQPHPSWAPAPDSPAA